MGQQEQKLERPCTALPIAEAPLCHFPLLFYLEFSTKKLKKEKGHSLGFILKAI